MQRSTLHKVPQTTISEALVRQIGNTIDSQPGLTLTQFERRYWAVETRGAQTLDAVERSILIDGLASLMDYSDVVDPKWKSKDHRALERCVTLQRQGFAECFRHWEDSVGRPVTTPAPRPPATGELTRDG